MRTAAVVLLLCCATAWADPVSEAQGVLSRVFGKEYLPRFNFSVIPAENGMDVFTVEVGANGVVQVGGNTGVSLASGLYYYAKNVSHLLVTWGLGGSGNNVKFPADFPPMAQVKIVSQVKYRYYMNVCTVSYSAAFWDWSRWEQEIDWMALHGVNLPLSFTGQEYVWYEFYAALGLTDSEIMDYFSGPAFLAWQRMGNIQKWGGPLTASWRKAQRDLQLQILQRTRALGMINALPGFSGHVPGAIKRVFPNVTLARSAEWGNFNATYSEDYLLEPTDPLFVTLGKTFYTTLIKEFGTDHVYQSDTYNEMTPSSKDPTFLKESNAAVYNAMVAADKDAIYLMQGWLFLEGFWGLPEVEAYLSGVPNSGMIILDLATEQAPQYARLKNYFGKSWIWCLLHNYGGRRGLYGHLQDVGTKPIDALAQSNGTMVGTGMTPEAIEQNPVMYEMLTEMYWRKEHVDTEKWAQDYGVARYGSGSNSNITRKVWSLLLEGAYQYPIDTSIVEFNPSNVGLRQPHNTNATLIAQAWYHLFNAGLSGEVDTGLGPYQYDLVDVGRQVLLNFFDDVFVLFQYEFARFSVHKEENTANIQRVGNMLLTILTDLDGLLGTNINFLLGVWLDAAKAYGTTPDEVALLEFNARNQITLWGPDGNINDYAAKNGWNGLVGDYYYGRWKQLVDTCVAGAQSMTVPDFNALSTQLLAWMRAWGTDSSPFPSTPSGDVMLVTYELLKKYMTHADATQNYLLHENMDIKGNELAAMWTHDVAQLKILCDLASDCVGFNSLGLLKAQTGTLTSVPGVDFYVKVVA
eukprot:m.190307 g.190307  ORF g.190307 m.190307 type:complete len:803 (+) comp21696_c0_seq6:142-2550(+)